MVMDVSSIRNGLPFFSHWTTRPINSPVLVTLSARTIDGRHGKLFHHPILTERGSQPANAPALSGMAAVIELPGPCAWHRSRDHDECQQKENARIPALIILSGDFPQKGLNHPGPLVAGFPDRETPPA